MMVFRIALFLLLPVLSSAFADSLRSSIWASTSRFSEYGNMARRELVLTTTLANSKRKNDMIEEASGKKAKAGIDEGMRSKLLSESIAPWRTVRLFLYASLGSGALIGGLITLSGVVAAPRNDVDLNTELLNLAIDFGAVMAFAIFFKLDIDKGAELNQDVEKKLEQKKEDKTIANAMKARESKLSQLMLKIRVSEDGKQTKEAPVAAIQSGAKQHLIIVAGERKVIREALLSANLVEMDFILRDVLIVPFEIGAEANKQVRPTGGFGERPTWESANYVAECVGEGWKEYIDAEMADAINQNGEAVKKDGIAIVLKNTGNVIRRGVGRVPWREMVDELEGKKDDEIEMADLSFLNPGQ